MNRLRHFVRWTGCWTLVLFAWTANALFGQSPLVNPKLVEFHRRFDPTLVAVGANVHAACGYDFANFGFVRGPDGVVVIDTGWFPGNGQPAWKQFRKQCDLPIRAIVYTHVHGDHTGGSGFFQQQAGGDVEVYAPHGWKERRSYSSASQFQMIFRRAFSQMGILLPVGEQGTIGSGIGPSPRPRGVPEFVTPTVTVDQPIKLTIAGIEMRLIPTPGDIASHMMVWLPNEQVLFCGDIIGGTFPYIATPRYEPDRDPRAFIRSLSLALQLKPQHVIPGHGRLLRGSEDVNNVLNANIDAIRFVTDQVERGVTNGQSADEIIDALELPAKLRDHPDLQPHYHRLDWIIRGLAYKQGGFASDATDLTRLTRSEESKRLVELLGGPNQVVQHADQALAANDARWAASLATYVLDVAPEHERAGQIRLRALRHVAATTDSAGERNYALTTVREETEGIAWEQMLSKSALRRASQRSSAELLADMGCRFQAENDDGSAAAIKIELENEAGAHFLVRRNGSLALYVHPPIPVSGRIRLSRTTLNKIWARQFRWSEALDQRLIEIVDGHSEVEHGLSLID